MQHLTEDKQIKKYAYQIDYKAAIEWCGNKYIQPFCEIYEVDPKIWELGTRRGAWPEDREEDPEIFQIMLSNCSDDDVSFLTKHFPDLLLIHGVRLDNWFLCVDHFGTAWDYVFTAFQPDKESLMLPKIWLRKEGAIYATSERVINIKKHANFKRYEVKA